MNRHLFDCFKGLGNCLVILRPEMCVLEQAGSAFDGSQGPLAAERIADHRLRRFPYKPALATIKKMISMGDLVLEAGVRTDSGARPLL